MPRRPAKYQPLADYLAAQAGERVTLTFTEIEAILGAELPATAHLRWWWGNVRTGPWSRAWLRVGWQVERPAVWFYQVTFVRQHPPVGMAPPLR